MSYIDKIKERAKLDKKTIVLPESKDKRTLLAAAKIMEEGIANIIMVGDEEKIMDGAGWLEVDLTNITVINPANTPKLEEYVNLLYETRKTKGMTPEKAREILLDDYLTFGIVMVKAGDADGMVAGACHSTADTLRPALQILKTAPGVKLVSAFFVMDTQFKDQGDEGAFLFADCGLNQDPTAEELAAIAETSYRSFKSLIGPKPVIAMLSHSTKGSAKHAMVDKVVEATRIAREEYPHLILDGELQLDAALVPVGGTYTVDAAGAKAVCEALNPKCVIPMHYRHAPCGLPDVAGVEDFLALWGEGEIRRLEGPALEVDGTARGVVVPQYCEEA